MSDNVNYTAAWHDYRRRRRWFWGVYLGGCFGMVGLWLLFFNSPIGEFMKGIVFCVLAPMWLIGFVVTAFRCQLFRCPRCHRRFFMTWWYHNSFARRCIHCGLPKWADEDERSE